MKIAVIGDAGLDNYIVGQVRGLSAEAPIPIVDANATFALPGMAANVTANLLTLGAPAFYLEHPDQNYPTKNRLMSEDGTQLARWDEEDWCKPYTRGDLIQLLEADAVIVSDYGKGAISEEVIQVLKQASMPVFVDTKGDPTPWVGSETATLFPNFTEYKRYEEKYNWFPNLVLKRGAEGLSFIEFGRVVLSRAAQARFVKSVNGAGDTVMAAFVVGVLAGFSLPQCLTFANAAAANVVEQPFNSRWTTAEATVARMEMNEVHDNGESEGVVIAGLLGSGSDSDLRGLDNGDEVESDGNGNAICDCPDASLFPIDFKDLWN